MSWHHPLEHKFFKSLKSERIEGRPLILAVSGGMDSMVLAEFCRRTLPKNKIYLFHFHHGWAKFEQKEFRDTARELVARYAKDHDLGFLTEESEKVLRSEADARRARREAAKRALRLVAAEKGNEPLLVWGHHSQDLLETRILRLVRGVGADGLKSMAIRHGIHLRPLLSFSKSEINEYANTMEVPYLNDPSNTDTNFLRNWVRHKWLPALERRRPGSLNRMAESLEGLVATIDGTSHQALPAENVGVNGLVTPWNKYLALSESEQSRFLASLFSQFNEIMWTRNHLAEARKQLARGKIGHRFKVAGLIVTVAKDSFRIDRGIV